MSEALVTKVVFAPDLIGASLADADARKIVQLWRDGAIEVLTNRELVALHLKCLRELGLPSALLTRWGLWLSGGAKSIYAADFLAQTSSAVTLCESLADALGASNIVASRFPEKAISAKWVTAGKFLKAAGLRSNS